MRGSVKTFINRRSDPISITNLRVRELVGYFIYCYEKLSNDGVRYSKKWIQTNTAFTIEDFLKMRFVDDYLIANKKYLYTKISALEHINFSYETQKPYEDEKNIERSDKIDVFINKIGLQDIWQTPDEHLYLAVECKRINELSDNKAYLNDIRKFCQRNYRQLRLPFEGMMAFVESNKLTADQISKDLNQRLKAVSDFTTTKSLSHERISDNFSSSYQSSHIRKIKDTHFNIYHLYFDYSNIILY